MAKNEKMDTSYMFNSLKNTAGIIRKAHENDKVSEQPEKEMETETIPKTSMTPVPDMVSNTVQEIPITAEKTTADDKPETTKEVVQKAAKTPVQKSVPKSERVKPIVNNSPSAEEKQNMVRFSVRMEEDLRNLVFQEALERSQKENKTISINEVVVEALKEHYNLL